MNPPDEVTVTWVSSAPKKRWAVVRRVGNGCSTARSASMRLRLWAPLTTAELIKESAVGGKIAEVGRPAQQYGIRDSPLQMPMRPLDCTILMRDTAVVAARRHGVMGAQGFVAQRPVGGCVAFKVAERGREAVTAMLAGSTAQCPKGILQAFGQGHEALATQYNMDMLEAAISQPEVIEPMDQGLAPDGDAQISHVSEVRQTHAARFLDLAENDLPLSAVQGPPMADAAFQSPPDSLAKFRVATEDLPENCHGSQPRCRFQHGHDLCVKDPRQGIGPSPVTPQPLERRRLRVLRKPVTRGRAETGFGGRDRRRVGRSILHE